jgi:hypothetical protein
MDDFNMRYSTDIYEIFQGTKRAANLNI